MRFYIDILSLVLLLAVLAGIVLFGLCVSHEPEIGYKQESFPHDFAQARDILHHSVQNQGQKLKRIDLTEDDLAAVANFALVRKQFQGYAKASIHDARLDFWLTIKLPFGSSDFLNIKLIADDAEPIATIKQLKIGRIALPKPIVSVLMWWAMRHTSLGKYGQLSTALISDIHIAENRLQVSLNWNPQTLLQANEWVTELSSKERLLIYHNKLAEILNQHSELKRYIGLNLLIRPLFALALSRSEMEANEAVEENRALILVLGAYANGGNLAQDISLATQPLAKRSVLLNRRQDTAQHFMGSAVMAISGHRALADMVGLAKEINDAHSGSGFSFTDLAADRAGALFGKAAVASADEALRVQRILSQTIDTSVFMPNIGDLPENLGVADFAERFKEIDSPEFQAVKLQIESRIAACLLYREAEAYGR